MFNFAPRPFPRLGRSGSGSIAEIAEGEGGEQIVVALPTTKTPQKH